MPTPPSPVEIFYPIVSHWVIDSELKEISQCNKLLLVMPVHKFTSYENNSCNRMSLSFMIAVPYRMNGREWSITFLHT